MNPQAAKAAGPDSAPAGCVYFVEAAKRRAKCRCCKSAIEPRVKHFCIRIYDAGWLRKYRVCGLCISGILKEIRSGKKPASRTSEKGKAEAASPNVALPDSASFDVLRKTIESRPSEQAPPSPDADAGLEDCGYEDDEGERQYCENCGKPIEIDCPECGRKRREWF